METNNPPPTMTEKMPTTKPPTRSSAVWHVSSQGAIALIHERSITVPHLPPTTVFTAFPARAHPPLENRFQRKSSLKLLPRVRGTKSAPKWSGPNKPASTREHAEKAIESLDAGVRQGETFAKPGGP